MIKRTIKNETIFKIKDEDTQTTFYGCDQEWYPTSWQRRAGCGPTAVTNIIYYLKTRSSSGFSDHLWLKSGALSLMEEIYQFVKPTLRGIPSTELLYEDVRNYAEAMAQEIKLEVFNISKSRSSRPQFQDLLIFLDKALANDTPVAFLNLDNGEEKRLDSWHWVTVISLEYSADGSRALLRILDGGHIKQIDLVQWFLTTKLGGGFVSFDYVHQQ
ncbi:hypothetical protein [Desulfosporosinus acidiphilus]|nr:hypothetical protein [Desulfosporosinus acidiphilus]